jgi:hypothetical protein
MLKYTQHTSQARDEKREKNERTRSNTQKIIEFNKENKLSGRNEVVKART